MTSLLDTKRQRRIAIFPNQNCELANKVFDEFAKPDRSKSSHISKHLLYSDDDSLKTTNIKTLISKSAELLKDSKFDIDANTWFIESHSYNSYNSNLDKLESLLTWHQDDYGGWSEKVSTILWYIRKDDSLNGGDLLWTSGLKDPDPVNYNWGGWFNKVKVDVIENEKINKTVVSENLVVLMTGDLWHCPEHIYGTGSRDLVVIQFKTK
jgi:hypothetical protein